MHYDFFYLEGTKMSHISLIIILMLTWAHNGNGETYNVLMVPLAMKSHLIIHMNLAKKLAEHNFDITICIPESLSSVIRSEHQNINIEKYHLRQIPFTEDTSEVGLSGLYKT